MDSCNRVIQSWSCLSTITLPDWFRLKKRLNFHVSTSYQSSYSFAVGKKTTSAMYFDLFYTRLYSYLMLSAQFSNTTKLKKRKDLWELLLSCGSNGHIAWTDCHYRVSNSGLFGCFQLCLGVATKNNLRRCNTQMRSNISVACSLLFIATGCDVKVRRKVTCQISKTRVPKQ